MHDGRSVGRRISVVGNSGSGKTTLSRNLARQLGYRHVEMDALYHQPDWQTLPTEQFQQAVADALSGDGWVVEGNYSSARPLVLERADTVIWLDLPRTVVMRQLLLRTLRRLFGRQVLWNGNRERWANLFSAPCRSSPSSPGPGPAMPPTGNAMRRKCATRAPASTTFI